MFLHELFQQGISAFFRTPPSPGKQSFCQVFRNPAEVITLSNFENVEQYFAQVEHLRKTYPWFIACIPYETGYYFEERFSDLLAGDEALRRSAEKMTFLFYEESQVERISSEALSFREESNAAGVEELEWNTSRVEFINAISEIKRLIAEGDTYQVNYTMQCGFRLKGTPEDLFEALLYRQSAGYAAFIRLQGSDLLTVSPELFFEVEGETITARPMKGTAKRGKTNEEDRERALQLSRDEKNRAENVMILDLLRNDLGRVCDYGSIEPFDMYKVEKYETVLQMTSSVRGKLRTGVSLPELLRELFPCGSITGAPKIRTMEIINQLEKEPRGFYTGSVGIGTPEKMIFNVAIRTVEILRDGRGRAGFGSGIVWDSSPEEEWEESLLKANFLTRPYPVFELLETMLWRDGEIELLEMHIERVREAAEYFLFYFDEARVRSTIANAVKNLGSGLHKVRMLVAKNGEVSVETTPEAQPPATVRIAFSDKRIDSRDPFRYYKTTNRALYNSEFSKAKAAGCFDLLFLNERSEVAEGAVTNLFVKTGEQWFTPPLSSGALNGVRRRKFILDHPSTIEAALTIKDLAEADGVFLTNAVKQVVPVALLVLPDGREIVYPPTPGA